MRQDTKFRDNLTKKGGTPPQKIDNICTLLFADGDVLFLLQVDSKSESAAFSELLGHLPTIQNLFRFSRVYSG